jgi:hypothetical protein
VAFGLFLVLTAILFLRPTEIIPSLDGMPLFEAVILLCLATTFPWVLAQLTPSALQARPITVCVLGVAIAVPLSHLTQGTDEDVVAVAAEFAKVVVYYLLLMAVVDTPRRLRGLSIGLLACLAIHTALALANFHGLAEIPAMDPVFDSHVDKESGEAISVARLCGVGLFGNPNDLSRILVVGIALTIYLMGQCSLAALPGLLGLAGLFGYALTQTHSRGGLIALAVTLTVLWQLRFGGKRTAVLALLAVPVGLMLFGARQTDLSTDEGTGQQRIQLWLEGFSALRESPVFGIGAGRYSEITGGLGAHNSFVESYVELGLVGGTCFLSAFLLGVWHTYQLRPARVPVLPNILVGIYPAVLAILAGYAFGLLTSSRNYVMPTYLLLGLTAAYQQIASGWAPGLAPCISGRLGLRLAIASGLILATVYLTAQAMVRWG